MFIVERQGSKPIVAVSPEQAVLEFWTSMADDDKENAYFNVWDTNGTDFFVIVHNVDWDPIEGPKEFDRIIHFDQAERKKLVEEMMYRAHCDDKCLRQLCEMAAMQINTQDAYKNWVREESDEADA